ncbi:MAG: NAD(+) synthase [Dehalococcoidia bacterium]|nr:NAD(+) synthase [Dehalococcoidia bacterium]
MTLDFLDVRGHGYLRVAVCVPRVRVADPAFNARAHVEALRQAHARGARYALCPELGLSGYSANDLFFQESLRRGCEAALAEVMRETDGTGLVVSAGMPLAVDGSLYNCAVTFQDGRILAVAPKSYPPNYREFYELRWFQPAANARATSVTLLGQEVRFGTDVLIDVPGEPRFTLHTDICEDIWVPVPPGTIAALSGATVLANLSASNVTVAKADYRRELVDMSSAKNIAVQLYSAAGFGESTADLAWDGHGIIADRGEIVTETGRFGLDGEVAVADVDINALAADRMRMTSFGQNAAAFARPVRRVAASAAEGSAEPYRELLRRVAAQPYVPADPAKRDERCREVFLIMASSLARRLMALPEHLRRMTIGVSGGRDSTLALLVAAQALDMLALPRERLIGVTLPGFGTSSATYNAAVALMQGIGATVREIDIRDVSSDVLRAIGHEFERHDVTFENVQAWTRKFLLFAIASEEQAIDLGTSDLSELALGWTTYGGDHMSHYGVNAGVPKTLVSHLIAWAAEVQFAADRPVADALRAVLATPITPELLPLAEDGTPQQLSEDTVGPYELVDFFLYHVTRFGFGPRRVARMALHAFEGRYTLSEIRRWLEVFIRRFFAMQFKRDCVPDSPKVGSGGSLSPRGDWRMPSDATPEAWLAELATIPA